MFKFYISSTFWELKCVLYLVNKTMQSVMVANITMNVDFLPC